MIFVVAQAKSYAGPSVGKKVSAKKTASTSPAVGKKVSSKSVPRATTR